jgi:hypothetical protein
MRLSDLKVQLHGNSAVVTGIWTGKGTDGGEERSMGAYSEIGRHRAFQ